jgi:DNA-directed RNA polymerase specialized sigma24 family protein
MIDPANSSDEELADSLSDSDDRAIAALVERHAQSLYDFALRATLDTEAAAEITAATFDHLRANARERSTEISLRAWLFGFALERALEVANDRDRGAGARLSSGDRRFTQTDASIDREAALWAWQAARSLRPRDYGVLDLTIRRELNPEELTGSATQTRGGVYSILGRANGAFAEAYVATALYFRGRDACNDLSELVGGSGAAMRVGIRRQIASHVEDCETCQNTLESLPNASDVFKALYDVQPPPELIDDLLAASAAAAAIAAGQLSLDDTASQEEEVEAEATEATDAEEPEAAGLEATPGMEPSEEIAEPAEEPAAPVSEEELWARPEGEIEPGYAGVGAAGLAEAISETEGRLGVEPDLPPYEPAEVYEQYGTEYTQQPYRDTYAPAGLTLSERLSLWFAPAYGRSFVLSYLLLGAATAIALYLGIAVADSLGGGGNSAAAVGPNQVLEIACESGPLSMEQDATKIFQFDTGSLNGFEIDNVVVSDKPAAATAGALTVTKQGAASLTAKAAAVSSTTARSDQYQLQITWMRDSKDAVTDCDLVVHVPASTAPAPSAPGTPATTETPGPDGTPATSPTP